MPIISDLVNDWLWPAGGSGGIWGDLAAGFAQALILGLATYLAWPPLHRRVDAWMKRHTSHANAELHKKLDHIIKHSDIPPMEDHADRP